MRPRISEVVLPHLHRGLRPQKIPNSVSDDSDDYPTETGHIDQIRYKKDHCRQAYI